MAAVMAARSGSTQPPKMKKPSMPLVQTNGNTTKSGQAPTSSPSSATKRLPGPTQNTAPSMTSPSMSSNTARATRRPQRISTRTGTSDNLVLDKRRQQKFPEPYVAREDHIFRKFKGRPPSLIVHLHPTNFRFDGQDGSFSYHSEMRCFIEHLQKGTIPHDMLEEFREGGVTFYDGWLIVKVVDHRHATSTSATVVNGTDDEKPFSVHNYNPYITPSPHAPYPTKEQTGQKASPSKQEKDYSTSGVNLSILDVSSSKPTPKVTHVALRPTHLSRQQDLVLDALAPDPKFLNRKQSQANVNGRSGGIPQTPTSGIPSTPLTEKGPPLKKQKMKIDAKDLLEYEARVINATAPPLYLEPAANRAEADAILEMLTDPFHDQAPPSPKGRKRTVAELAADDAHAKEQERFMLIMDERNVGNTGGANASGVDGQTTNTIFQPRFEKFNALETLKREMIEKDQREKARQLQEDENRREMQQRQAEEERRKAQIRVREQSAIRLRQQQQDAHQLALQQQAAAQQQAQAARQQQQQQAQQAQASGIPPQVQNQVMGNQQRSSPIIGQGTPHAASSPVINQGGAGSPTRPGSAMQHGHPMARGQSNSGQSRHGTPQMPNATPGMRNATPVLRQGTPAQHMTQASPHNSMMAPTPQMSQTPMMGNQLPNGMNAQQAELQRRQAALRMQQMQQQQQQQQAAAMMNGNPQMNAHQMAQHVAMTQRQNSMHQQQQNMHQQNQQMGQSPAQAHGQYNKQLSEQMKAQMQGLQGNGQGSPVQNQMTPQQQQAALAHQQQQQRMMQQGQMMGNMQGNAQQGQQRAHNQFTAFYQQAMQKYQQQLIANATQRYGGNPANIPPAELQKLQQMAQQAARQETQARQQKMQQAMQRSQQQQAQQHGMVNGMNMMNPNMAAMQQQQQAQHMQGMQLAHAQQMLAQQQQQPNMYAQMQMQQQQQQQQQQQRPG